MQSRMANGIIFSVGSVLGVSYGMFLSIVPIFAKDEINASYSELGLIGVAHFLPYMFVPLIVGIMLSKYNNSYLLTAGVAINAVCIYMLSVANSVTEVAIYRMGIGLALSFFWPSCQAIIYARSDEKSRAKHLSMFTMFYVLGFMMGPLVGNILIDGGTEYRTLFQIASFVMAVAMISILVRTRKKNEKETVMPSLAMFRQFVKYPIILIMTVYSALTFGVILTIYPAFLNDNGVSDVDILLLFFIFGAARAGTLFASKWLTKHPNIVLIGTIFAIAIGLMLSHYFNGSFSGLVIAVLFLGFGLSVFLPFMLDLILKRSGSKSSGIMIGVYESIYGIGWGIGPVIGGLMSEFYGVGATYMLFSIMGIIVGILAIIRRKSLTITPYN